ncbi:DEP domain-containing protein [Balamuthia mandrillaris]
MMHCDLADVSHCVRRNHQNRTTSKNLHKSNNNNTKKSISSVAPSFSSSSSLHHHHHLLLEDKENEPPLKGRLTVYSIAGCAHCTTVKRRLLSRGIPFCELDLEKLPELRADMRRRTGGRNTVPQLFLNGRHVGGHAELLAQEESDGLASWLQLLRTEEAGEDAPPLPCSSSSSPGSSSSSSSSSSASSSSSSSSSSSASVAASASFSCDSCSPSFRRSAAVAAAGSARSSFSSFSSSESEREYEEESIVCEPDVYLKIVTRMRSLDGVPIATRTYMFRSYPNTFVGCEAVDWLLTKQSDVPVSSRKEAVELGEKLLQKHFFHHVHYDHGFKDEKLFYRFLQDDDASIKDTLNTDHLSECEPRPAAEISEELRRCIMKLYNKYLTEDGKILDYVRLGRSKAFKRYVQQTAELQRVNITDITREEKMAFFINIYNALVVHATVIGGSPSSSWQRSKFFNKMSYLIGGQVFSLNDIEHGVLRSNKRPPSGIFRQFGRNDPRLPAILNPPDPRVHFALVCGAKSCPSIKTYSPENIDEALDIATMAFFEDGGCVLIPSRREISLSKLLQWYKCDFGKSEEEMLRWISRYLPPPSRATLERWLAEENYKLTYQSYDWTPNAK